MANRVEKKQEKNSTSILIALGTFFGGVLAFWTIWTSSNLDEPTKYFVITLLIIAVIMIYVNFGVFPRIKSLEEKVFK